ncbi:hypothetical protein BDZ94DRAFT_1325264 [Collybia nuda]|uniref:Uncharacterized protein n=1 Tax=Collybia nuda TaxID=64659 RepID=A0A9P6CF86_9AGAR|nr:hypothetical protein BDZ94DRAFT_1325264 [Collybia nuda]
MLLTTSNLQRFPTMPYHEGSQNPHIEGSTMIDVAGNYTHNNHSSHVTNKDSGNTTTYNVKDSYNDSSQRHIGNKNTYMYGLPENYPAKTRAPYRSTPKGQKHHRPSNIPESAHGLFGWGQPTPRLECYPEPDSNSEGISEDDEQRYHEELPPSTAPPLWMTQAPFSPTPSQTSYDGSFHSFSSSHRGSQAPFPSTPPNPNLVPRNFSPNNPFLPYISPSSPSGSRTGSPVSGQNIMIRGGGTRSTQH